MVARDEPVPPVVSDPKELQGFAAFKPSGPHDELKPLLVRVGLQRLVKTFAKWDITAISCLRSLMALSQLVPTLKSLGIEDEATIQKLQAAIISTETFDVEAAKAAAAAAEEAESSSSEEEEEEEEKQPKSKHKVHLSKKEYDEILQWSDDEDMTTVHGRFRHRQKTQANWLQSHDMQYMSTQKNEGEITDVSKGPRSILKKLIKAPTGYQNPVDGFEVDLVYKLRLCPTVTGEYGPACGTHPLSRTQCPSLSDRCCLFVCT